MENQIDEQIKKEFSTVKKGLTDKIIKELVQYCEVYNLTPEELFEKWEPYAISNIPDDSINEDLLEEFRISVLQNEIENNKQKSKAFVLSPNRMNIKNEKKIYNKNDVDNLDEVVSEIININKRKKNSQNVFGGTIASPGRNNQNSISFPSRANVPYSPTKYRNISKKDEISSMTKKFLNRQRIGELEDILNRDIPKPNLDSSITKDFSIFLLDDKQICSTYRYMYTKLSDLSDILDERIDYISELIRDHNGIEEFANPYQIINEDFYTAGRICYDIIDILDASTVKNNENSVLIEPSKRIASGHKIRLNFSKLANEGKQYTLFPGQIIGVKGTNPTGKCIEVSEIIEPPSLPIPTSPSSDILQYYTDCKGQPLSIFVASGPYTCEDSLNYEPLAELFEKYIIPEKPDILILMGPFIDDRHPKIQNGDTELTPEDLFSKYISPHIVKFYMESAHSKIIIIPSNNDIITNSVCFPQPPLDSEMMMSRSNQFNKDKNQQILNTRRVQKRKCLGLPVDEKGERIFYYPNPVQFQVNDIVFAVCNNDILTHLSKEEVSHSSFQFGSPTKGSFSPKPKLNSNPNSSNRSFDKISRLTRHLLQQRSFYPLFPPALDEANIIYNQSKGFDIDIKPDVLILNSAQRRFAKIIDGMVCVNPGQVVHKIAGTFSKLYIYPLNPKDLPNHLNDVKIKVEDDIKLNIKKEEEEDNKKNIKLDIKKEEDGDEDSTKDMEIDKEKDVPLIHEVSERCRVEIQRV
ncbi:DNA polymerase alpha/epsilon subunit B-domain-containing protein [Neocallimastix lanati (nom. inval.)]|jgi:DNA polymerase alpha subunit B|nr:DNA polymerase alpha/epsilon subunit B-domain-containing protein [Neocallimastix sp. JGI-2020a]